MSGGRSCGPEAAREVVQAVCRAYNKNVCPDYTDDEIITAREKWAEILHTMHRHGKFSTGNDVQVGLRVDCFLEGTVDHS